MKQKTWPCKSDSPHFIALPFLKKPQTSSNFTKSYKIYLSYFTSKPNPSSSLFKSPDFSDLPYDVLARITAFPDLRAASLVCRAWRDALKPLREAMVFLKWGKRFKHGRWGMKANLSKALDSFLKGAARGSTLALVDAGLIYWELGRREEGISWYRRAAELGDPAGQCNLALSYLQGRGDAEGCGVPRAGNEVWREGCSSCEKHYTSATFCIVIQ
ncbi:F-box protein At1g70590-like isoform X2 [Primulina tabacum]|uniref:F-box protein At1g70590-like isoform X2 n=1 Tax=Primulina tabacum TaxID=48773 RepID=UPI003F5A9190